MNNAIIQNYYSRNKKKSFYKKESKTQNGLIAVYTGD